MFEIIKEHPNTGYEMLAHTSHLKHSRLDAAFAIEEIRNKAGAPFNPDVVEAYINIWKREGPKLLSKHSA